MVTNNEDLIAETAAFVRASFVNRHQLHYSVLKDSGQADDRDTRLGARWEGGEDSRGARHEPIWPALGRLAFERGLDPEVWVDTLFSLAHTFDRPITPADLRNPNVLKAVAKSPERRAMDVAFGARSERLLLAQTVWLVKSLSALTPSSAERRAILDPSIEVSALARYTLAFAKGHLDLAKGLEASAFLQYRRFPEAYDEAFDGPPSPVMVARLASEKESRK